jgi:endonuclease G
MKKITTILFLFLLNNALAQDLIVVKNKAYTTTFSKSKHYPVLVEWWVTKPMVQCKTKNQRTDIFSSDPKLKKWTNLSQFYKNSGYDRGHIFPALYAECDKTIMKESFYYSNIMAQTPQLNRGDWKTVEELTKLECLQYDSVYVWAGGIGEIKKLGNVSVPEKCWKVVWVKSKNEYFSFIFENNFSLSNGINDNKTTLKALQKLTGFSFKK